MNNIRYSIFILVLNFLEHKIVFISKDNSNINNLSKIKLIFKLTKYIL